MLPKAYRLTAKEIETLSAGKSVFGTLISMRYAPSSATKFSVSVSKKTAPRAVDRNSLRRKIYIAIENAGLTFAKPAFAMLMPKKECLKVSQVMLETEIKNLFIKAGISRI